MSDHKCFTQLAEKWDGPIEKPVSWDRETGDLKSSWMLKVFKYTKAGNISRNGGGWLRLNYCPLCGEKLEGAK